MRVLVLFFVSFLSVALCDNAARYWDGEWGVKVAEGVDPQFLESLGFTVMRQIGSLPDTYLVRHASVTAKRDTFQIEAMDAVLQEHSDVVFSEKQYKKKMFTRNSLPFPDPLYANQWHLVNTGQQNGTVGEDISIVGAWNMGYSGHGVRIAIVDDGFQYTHPDLAVGYQPDTSYNFNEETDDPYPGEYDWHGTSAAGVALASNNSVCGVGSAYGAQGSGLRLLGDWFTDFETAFALSFENQKNHIYSNSWGPSDDGLTVEGPGRFTLAAIQDSITNGRGGLGSVYVWAAGNGLQYADNCNYDGFANSRFIIAVGAIGNDGKQSYYSEPCSAMLVTAPSSGRAAGITTTDILGSNGYDDSDCTADFGGTSSACPLAAGVVALLLEANPKLTWRDVQQVLLQSADKNDATDSDWAVNGAGYHINHKYGFGRVNATAAVRAALAHTTLPDAKLVTYEKLIVNTTIPAGNTSLSVNASVAVNAGLILEHVEVSVNIPDLLTAGDLKIVLTSPSGTQSVLADQHAISLILLANLPNSTTVPQDLNFVVGQALFGPYIRAPINGTLAIPQPSSSACGSVDEISNCAQLQGMIALVDRAAGCNYTTQVYNAQQCGAIAVVVVNNFAGAPVTMTGTNRNITIPSVMIDLDDGTIVKQAINETGSVFFSVFFSPTRANLTYQNWWFSTVRNWGEKSDGNWTLEVMDTFSGGQGSTLVSWDLRLYGRSSSSQGDDDGLEGWVIGVIVAASIAVVVVGAATLYYFRRKRGNYQEV